MFRFFSRLWLVVTCSGLSLHCDWSLHAQVCLDCDGSLHAQICLYSVIGRDKHVTTNHNLETWACSDQSHSRDKPEHVTTNHNLETNLAYNDQSQSRDKPEHVTTNHNLETNLACNDQSQTRDKPSLDCDWSWHAQVCLYIVIGRYMLRFVCRLWLVVTCSGLSLDCDGHVATNHNLETNLACNDQS
jgi:hypothetical protein